MKWARSLISCSSRIFSNRSCLFINWMVCCTMADATNSAGYEFMSRSKVESWHKNIKYWLDYCITSLVERSMKRFSVPQLWSTWANIIVASLITFTALRTLKESDWYMSSSVSNIWFCVNLPCPAFSSRVRILIASTSSSFELMRTDVRPMRYKLSGPKLICYCHFARKYLSRIVTAEKKVEWELTLRARKTWTIQSMMRALFSSEIWWKSIFSTVKILSEDCILGVEWNSS